MKATDPRGSECSTLESLCCGRVNKTILSYALEASVSLSLLASPGYTFIWSISSV